MGLFTDRKGNLSNTSLVLGGLLAMGSYVALQREEDPDNLTLPAIPVGCDKTYQHPSNAQIALDALSPQLGYCIESYKVDNPKGVIVQIDLAHGGIGFDEALERTLRPILCQARDIVAHFASHCGSHHIYHDGITDATAENLATVMHAYKMLGSDPTRPTPEILKKARLSDEQARKVVDKMHAAFSDSAVFELAKDSRFIFRPSESQELLRRANKLIGKVGSSKTYEELWKETTEAREDEMIKRMRGDNNGVAIIALGGAHDLSNNIKDWNRSHPDYPYSYLKIRPAVVPPYTDLNRLVEWLRRVHSGEITLRP